MTLYFIRHLIIHTICNVTGEPYEAVDKLHQVPLDTRDWEQVFTRLEATLDIQTGMLMSPERSIFIDTLSSSVHLLLRNNKV